MTSGVSGLVTITVTGQFVDLSDRPANGHVVLAPVNRVAGNNWIVVGTPVRVHIKNGTANGQMITNQAALSGDLYVRVSEQITGEQPQQEPYVVKPEGTTLNLTTAPRVANPPPGQLFIPASAIGQPNGIATLGSDGKLTASQRPPGGGGGVTSHHDLDDLTTGDDHPQYLTPGRGDVRYAPQAETASALAGKENTGTAAAAVAAHVAQPDPHAQYLTQARGDLRYVRPVQLAPVATGGTYADLSGLVPTSALPALAISDVFPVNTEAQMLALTAQRGDVAIRSDILATFILAADNPSVLANWKQLPNPANTVLSVNGQNGVVVLGKGDVGLSQVANLAPADMPISSATQTALNVLSVAVNDRLRYDPVAVRYGCKAITMDPHSISPATPQYIPMPVGRFMQYWVPLVQGAPISGVRLPVQQFGEAGGSVRFVVYQDDNTQLGETGDVGVTLQDPAVSGTWVALPLLTPAASTGPGVWITALATGAPGPSTVFSNTSGTAGIPDWLLNPASHLTALRNEGVSAPPPMLAPETGIPYIDFVVGVY